MTHVHKVRCSEIWGGNRGDELLVETSGIRASLFSRACDGGKGGDIYFFSVCGKDLLTRIAIVDVVGHGSEVSETSSWLYESLSERMNSAEGNEVLSDLNRATVERGLDSVSTAAVAAFYRENSELYYSYAGHHETLFLQKGTTEWRSLPKVMHDEIEGLPLGVTDDCRFAQYSAPAGEGDRLFFYTDGLIEATNSLGEQFGVKRLISLLDGFVACDLTTVRQGVVDSLLEFTGGSLEHDDVTFMVLEVGVSNEEVGD